MAANNTVEVVSTVRFGQSGDVYLRTTVGALGYLHTTPTEQGLFNDTDPDPLRASEATQEVPNGKSHLSCSCKQENRGNGKKYLCVVA